MTMTNGKHHHRYCNQLPLLRSCTGGSYCYSCCSTHHYSLIRNFQCTKQHIVDLCVDSASNILELFVYCIGPLLILLALSIVGLLAYTFFGILLPMIYNKHQHQHFLIQSTIVILHCSIVIVLLVNVLYNYACCVLQKHTGNHYDTIIYELAAITNIKLPTNAQELLQYRRQLSATISQRMKEHQQQQQSTIRSQQQQQEEGLTVESNHNMNNNSEMTQRRTTTTTTTSSNSDTTANNHDPLATTGTTNTTIPYNTSSQPTATTITQQQQLIPTTAVVIQQSSQPQSQLQQHPIRTWMVLGPYEWGYCSQTQQPKPPRSHYDHVSSKLILNLDHYCPWMFNAVGYFNYRYFVNFLIFTFISMFYGAIVMLEPFLLLKSTDYYRQSAQLHQELALHHVKGTISRAIGRQILQQHPRIQPMLPYRDEKLYLTLSFMLCVAVGIALIGLGGFHLYLVSTGQTTIEFHGNWAIRRRYEQIANIASLVKNGKKKSKWQNPYSRGTVLSNWQQVYGVSTIPLLKWIGCGCSDRSYINLLFCILIPNRNLPEYLPVPIPGQPTLRSACSTNTTTKNPNDVDGTTFDGCDGDNNNAYHENDIV